MASPKIGSPINASNQFSFQNGSSFQGQVNDQGPNMNLTNFRHRNRLMKPLHTNSKLNVQKKIHELLENSSPKNSVYVEEMNKRGTYEQLMSKVDEVTLLSRLNLNNGQFPQKKKKRLSKKRQSPNAKESRIKAKESTELQPIKQQFQNIKNERIQTKLYTTFLKNPNFSKNALIRKDDAELNIQFLEQGDVSEEKFGKLNEELFSPIKKSQEKKPKKSKSSSNFKNKSNKVPELISPRNFKQDNKAQKQFQFSQKNNRMEKSDNIRGVDNQIFTNDYANYNLEYSHQNEGSSELRPRKEMHLEQTPIKYPISNMYNQPPTPRSPETITKRYNQRKETLGQGCTPQSQLMNQFSQSATKLPQLTAPTHYQQEDTQLGEDEFAVQELPSQVDTLLNDQMEKKPFTSSPSSPQVTFSQDFRTPQKPMIVSIVGDQKSILSRNHRIKQYSPLKKQEQAQNFQKQFKETQSTVSQAPQKEVYQTSSPQQSKTISNFYTTKDQKTTKSHNSFNNSKLIQPKPIENYEPMLTSQSQLFNSSITPKTFYSPNIQSTMISQQIVDTNLPIKEVVENNSQIQPIAAPKYSNSMTKSEEQMSLRRNLLENLKHQMNSKREAQAYSQSHHHTTNNFLVTDQSSLHLSKNEELDKTFDKFTKFYKGITKKEKRNKTRFFSEPSEAHLDIQETLRTTITQNYNFTSNESPKNLSRETKKASEYIINKYGYSKPIKKQREKPSYLSAPTFLKFVKDATINKSLLKANKRLEQARNKKTKANAIA